MAEYVRHKRRYRIRPRFFIFVVMLVVVAWFGWHFVSLQINKSMVETIVVENGIIEATEETDLLLSRKGTIIRSPVAGAVKPLVKEGERVGKDTPIFQVVNEEQAKESDSELGKKKKAREKMIKEWKTTDSKFQQQIEETDKKARKKIEEIAALPAEDTAKASQLQEELNLLFKEGQRLTSVRGETAQAHKTALAKLDKEISELNAKYLSATTTYRAPTTGLVSFCIGDAALPYSDNSLMKLTPSQLGDFDDAKTLEDGKYLKKDEPVAEILDNTLFKVLLSLPSEKGEKLAPGTKYQLVFQGDKAEEITVDFVGFGKTLENKVVVIVQSSQWLEMFSSKIKYKGKFILGRYEGVLIPTAALVNQGNDLGVYVKVKGDFVFRVVKIIGEDGKNAAVSGIEAGTFVVVNPERLRKFL